MDSNKEERGLSRLGGVLHKRREDVQLSAEHHDTQNISWRNNTNSGANMLLMAYYQENQSDWNGYMENVGPTTKNL